MSFGLWKIHSANIYWTFFMLRFNHGIHPESPLTFSFSLPHLPLPMLPVLPFPHRFPITVEGKMKAYCGRESLASKAWLFLVTNLIGAFFFFFFPRPFLQKMNKCLLPVLSLHSLGSPLEMGMKGKESHSQDVYSNHALKSIGDG